MILLNDPSISIITTTALLKYAKQHADGERKLGGERHQECLYNVTHSTEARNQVTIAL